MEVTVDIVQRLIEEQFSQWKDLKICPVEKSGHDNYTFHLGDNMVIRLPSGKDYATQVSKENTWLPFLQKQLDYPISNPLSVGKPTSYFPFPWSINQWIEGETLLECKEIDKMVFARDLAIALRKLQSVECVSGPKAGIHNFYRGGDLKVYNLEVLQALEELKNCLPTDKLLEVWNQCISTVYKGQGVWVHGDIAPGNILLKDNRFSGLIDFGILGVGDPACDYAMAWTYFDMESRKVFLKDLSLDLIACARGWALWKALITYNDSKIDVKKNARDTINAILDEAM